MATTIIKHPHVVKLHYGKKDWFKSICGLNNTGLIPGQTLTEKHVSRQDCIDTFGDQKANNGYKVGKNSKFRDRVVWLWKCVHQADRLPNNDIGLKFCQGFLYEHRHGRDTVDWAQFAVNTVKWFSNSKGITKVHKDWAYAYPSITIDVEIGRQMYRVHPTLPIEENERTFKVPTTSDGGDAKKRRVESSTLQPNTAVESNANMTGLHKVKLEDIPMHISSPPAETSSLIPTQKAPKPVEEMPSSGCTPTSEIPSPTIPTLRAPKPVEEMPSSGCTLTSEIPSPTIPTPRAPKLVEEMPSFGCTPTPGIPNPTIPIPKVFAENKEMPFGCIHPFINALQLFRADIEKAVNVSIKDLEDQKARLKTILDHCHHDVEMATSTCKMLMDDLEGAKIVLSTADTDDNLGEVRYIQSVIKSGENKLSLKKAKYDEMYLEWRLQVQLLTEKHQAQQILETHFQLKDEEDQPFGSS